MHKARWAFGPSIIVAIWLIAGWLRLLNPLFIPSLPDVLLSLWNMTVSGDLLVDLASTAWRTLIGFILAAMIGIPLGLILGSKESIRQASSVVVDFFRSVPGTALFPLFLLFFGIGDRAKIANAVFACALLILVNAMYGVRNANKTRILAAQTMGASPTRIYFRVVLPSALPEIVGGLRIAISIALIVIVVTEMFVGTASGLGRRIFRAHDLFQIPEMYAAILLTGLFGYALNLLLIVVERRLVFWGGK
jgi:ABC-type nitrate/sulfonate/bicarbonate transport system permease component